MVLGQEMQTKNPSEIHCIFIKRILCLSEYTHKRRDTSEWAFKYLDQSTLKY